jgi:hypothetical protein
MQQPVAHVLAVAGGLAGLRGCRFLRMLNWRRDPAREMRLKEHALLDWIESEIDLIEADLPSSSTPPPTIAPSSNASCPSSVARRWLSSFEVEVRGEHQIPPAPWRRSTPRDQIYIPV